MTDNEYYDQSNQEYKNNSNQTNPTDMAAEYDSWADQWDKNNQEVDDARQEYETTNDDSDPNQLKKWKRPTAIDVEEIPLTPKPPPSPEPPEAPETEVKFYEPRGNPVETLRSSAEIHNAMTGYIDNLSVQEESCREIIRLCKPTVDILNARTLAYSRERTGDATPEDIQQRKINANKPTDTKLSADEAVRLHLVGEIFTAMTRFWNQPIFCGFAFEAIAIMASNQRAKRISVSAESQRQLKQIGDGFQAFIGATDAHHNNPNAMANFCECVALLSENLPTNRDFMVKAGAPQAITNALDCNPTSIEVVVAGARALHWISKADGRRSDGVQMDLRVCKAFPALIGGMACTRSSNPPVTFREGYRAIQQLAIDRKSRAHLGNSGAIGILVDGKIKTKRQRIYCCSFLFLKYNLEKKKTSNE